MRRFPTQDRQRLSDRILLGAQALEELRRAGIPDSGPVQRLARTVAELHQDLEALADADADRDQRQQDVETKQRTLDAELARTRRLLAWTPLAYVVTTGAGAGTIVEVSREASRLFGTSDEDETESLADWIAPADADRLDAIARRVDEDERADEDTVHMRRNGAICRLRVATEHDMSGEVTGHVWLFDEPTAIPDSPELETMSKTEFVARLAHELRNPLAPVRAAVDLWRQHGDRLTPDQRQWTIDVVARQADHLAYLVDHLLDLAEFSPRNVPLRRTFVDLGAIAEQAHDVVRSEAQLRHVEIETPVWPVYVEADAAQLCRVVVELLQHELRVAPRGSEIFVRVAGDVGHAVLTVHDQGKTFADDIVDTVFAPSPHVRATPVDPRHPLVRARRMIELHGGRVTARTAEDGSRTVEVRLPRVPTDAVPKAAHDHGIADDRPLRVLLVDDNVDAAEMLALLLEARGLETTLAFDGQGALAAFEWSRPDAVLLDLGLPDMDGLDVARQLHARVPSLPLIALTGFGDEATRNRTTKLGFAHHLTKPVDVGAVCRVLDDVPKRPS
ncbi:MAG TPA: response regulator [Nannocystaceae bacterium]|nr:response regulator [Nannocystaceae bacterium]